MQPAAANFRILSSLRCLTADFFFRHLLFVVIAFPPLYFRLNCIGHIINRGLACTQILSALM